MSKEIVWFIINCDQDNSTSLLRYNDVIYDPQSVEIGSEVGFLYGGARFDGKVVDFGNEDDYPRLSRKRAEMKKEKKEAKRAALFHEGAKRSAAQKGRQFISRFAVANRPKRAKPSSQPCGTTDDTDNGDGIGSADDAESVSSDSDDPVGHMKTEYKKASMRARADDFSDLRKLEDQSDSEKSSGQPKTNKKRRVEVEFDKEGLQSSEEETIIEESKSEKGESEKSKSEKSKSEKSKSEKSESEKSKSEESKSEKSKSEKSESEKSKSEKSKSEESKSEESKTEKKKSGSNKSGYRNCDSDTEEVESSDENEKSKSEKKKSGSNKSGYRNCDSDTEEVESSDENEKSKSEKKKSGSNKSGYRNCDSDTEEVESSDENEKSKSEKSKSEKSKSEKSKSEKNKKRKKKSKRGQKPKPAVVFQGNMFLNSPRDKDVNSEEILGVTISNDNLSKAKEKGTATDLARALFRVVFTSDALNSCSLGGNAANGLGSRSTPRPALDPDAVHNIFAYVAKRQKLKGWKPATPMTVIKQSVRVMLAEIRRKKK